MRGRVRGFGRCGSGGAWRSTALVAAVWLAGAAMPAAAQSDEEPTWFPEARYFRASEADLSEPRFGAGLITTDLFAQPARERPAFELPRSAERVGSRDVQALVALGATLPVWRGSLDEEDGVLVGLQAAVFSRFRMGAASRDAVGEDWIVGVPVELRRGRYSGRLRVLHRSSHLGDELMEASGAHRLEFTHELVDVVVAYVAAPGVRVYGGGGVIFRSRTHVLREDPRLRDPLAEWIREGDRLEFQAGADAAWRPWLGGRLGVVAALDVRAANRTDWASQLAGAAGLTAAHGGRRAHFVLRVFRGPSLMGQFFLTPERFWGLEAGVRL